MTLQRLLVLRVLRAAVGALTVSLAVISCARAAPEAADSTSAPKSTGSWLRGSDDERFAQIERHLRGLDVAMAEIGYRYGELVTATAQQRWELARYHTQKIDLALRLAVERRPARGASARPFLDNTLPAVLSAIEHSDAIAVDSAMITLRTACAACHAAENVAHFNEVVERIWQRSR